MYNGAGCLKIHPRSHADAQVRNHGGVGLGIADSRNSDDGDSLVLRSVRETYVQGSDAAY